MKHQVSIVVAVDSKSGIGKEGKIPWKDAEDMKYFKELTTKTQDPTKRNVIIMGRVTFESIGKRPLPDRENIVLRSDMDLNKVLSTLDKSDKFERVFIIGGESIYKLALENTRCNTIFLTRIPGDYNCDRHFTFDTKEWTKVSSVSNSRFEMWSRTNHEEYQYLGLVEKIINQGYSRIDRTLVGTKSIFGAMMRFNLRGNTWPLLTTKRVWVKGVVEELLWFISGSTDEKLLSDKGVNIWKGNTTREALDKRKLNHLDVGDCGPIYGFQWRHFGAEYKGYRMDYKGKGFDQLQRCIDMIKTTPNSRQIVMSAWCADKIDEMSLPPCHVMYQFYVMGDELSCMLTQRSGDMGLGVPFNIASASLLTHMIAQICDLKSGELIHSLGDAHVYNNHVKALSEQIVRTPFMFPKVKFSRNVRNVDDFVYSDVVVEGYNNYGELKMEMAV